MPSTTLSTLRTNFRTEIKDGSVSSFDNTEANAIINRALGIMSRDTERLRIAKAFLHTANVPQITYSHNLVRIYKAWWNTMPIGIEHMVSGGRLHEFMGGQVSSRPQFIMPFEDQHTLVMYPRPDASPLSTTLNGAISASATQDITVTSLTPFAEDFGRAIIDTGAATAEEVEYHGKDTANVQIEACTRGHGLTTAQSSHLDGRPIHFASLVVYASYIHPILSNDATVWKFPDDFEDLFLLKAAEIAHRIRRRLPESRNCKMEYDEIVGQYTHRAEWLANEGWWPRDEGSLFYEHE
jgi:hypothetical protein